MVFGRFTKALRPWLVRCTPHADWARGTLRERGDRRVTITKVRIFVCHSATVRARGTGDVDSALRTLRREFPSVAVEVERLDATVATPLPTIDLASWNDARRDFEPFDAHVEDLARRGPAAIVLRGEARACLSAAHEMLTRWQRLLDRRNGESRARAFDELLRRFCSMHDMSKPLVRADHKHALDTWQWVLRLAPDASGPLQIAALLHDVERLESESEARVEHLSPDYGAFKRSHAYRGAHIARALARECAFDERTCERVADLVMHHEVSGEDTDRALLNDADALSFFSQNSAGYMDYFGLEQTRRKIAYTLGRMRGLAWSRLEGMRLRADVAALLGELRVPLPPLGGEWRRGVNA
jgi:hypothetical protein